MTNYYIEKDNKIVLFDTDKNKIQNTLIFMPQYEGLEIKETQRPIVDFRFADTDEYKSEQLAKAKKTKLAENKTAYDAALKAGVTYKGELFDCDTLAAVRIMGQMVAAQTQAIADEETIDWFDYNYKPVTLTISEFMELAGLVTLNTRRIETLNCGFNTAVENAQTIEEIEAIEIDYNTLPVVDEGSADAAGTETNGNTVTTESEESDE